MKIKSFTAWHVQIPLKRTVKHASHTRQSTDNLVVKCTLSDGTIGWGESVPRTYVTGESIDDVFFAFQELQAATLFDGTIESTGDVVGRLSDWIPDVPRDKRDGFGNCLKCAIELSVLDAVGKATLKSVSQILAEIEWLAPILKRSESVRYSTAITTMKPRKQFLQALLMKAGGFRQMKVKIGAESIDDEAMLKRIRRIMGSKIDLRVDANEAYEPDQLEEKMAPLIPFGITSLEQPVKHEQIDQLATVRKQISVPIMLDESLCSVGDAKRAIRDQTCDLFNVRISKCGGLINSARIALIANEAGLGYQLGCQVGESGILSAAGRHFACSIGSIRYLEGSFDKFLVKERLTKQDLTFGYGGKAKAIAGPGLGIDVNESTVERIAIRRAVKNA